MGKPVNVDIKNCNDANILRKMIYAGESQVKRLGEEFNRNSDPKISDQISKVMTELTPVKLRLSIRFGE